MKAFHLFFAFLLILFSCNREQKGTSFKINGHFSNSKGDKVLLCEIGVKNVTILDSAVINKNGKISLSHAIDQPGFYMLKFSSGGKLILALNTRADVKIKGDLLMPTCDFAITGSNDSQLLQEFFKATSGNQRRIDSIKRMLSMHEGSDDFLRYSMIADSLFSSVSVNQKILEKKFIDQNPNSLASLIVLNYAFGPKPVLTMEDDLQDYVKLMNLFQTFPGNKHVLFHIERVNLYINHLKNPEH
jgi:hypothetical protein